MAQLSRSPRKICVVTGSRAEFGLLAPLMQAVKHDPALELQVVATGMHLSPEFGLTYRAIEEAGFRIDAKVETLLSSDSSVGIAKSIGLGVIGFADAFDRLAPDIVVLLGDRYEIFAAAQAAMASRLVIAHIHGGETTEGAVDEAMRHGISKMAHIHYASEEPYRKRLIQLGERPDRVLNVGSLGVENILNLKLLSQKDLESSLGFSFGKKAFLVTYHPVTLEKEGPEKSFGALLEALDRFSDASILFTKPNSDMDGRAIGKMIDEYVSKNAPRAAAFTSLGQIRYLSTIRCVSAVIGNSSSGIIEVPAFGIPTVNIGDRQKGRMRHPSVIQSGETRDEIVQAIEKALEPRNATPIGFVDWTKRHSDVSARMKNHLKTVDLSSVLKKKFFDVSFQE